MASTAFHPEVFRGVQPQSHPRAGPSSHPAPQPRSPSRSTTSSSQRPRQQQHQQVQQQQRQASTSNTSNRSPLQPIRNARSHSPSAPSSSSPAPAPSTQPEHVERAESPPQQHEREQEHEHETHRHEPQAPQQEECEEPIHGVQIPSRSDPIFSRVFPPYPSTTSDAEEWTNNSQGDNSGIRLVTAANYAELVHRHANIRLASEEILFPWLHGADVPFSAQAANFGYRNGLAAPVPRYRGLVTFCAHGTREEERDEELYTCSCDADASFSQDCTREDEDATPLDHSGSADCPAEAAAKSSCFFSADTYAGNTHTGSRMPSAATTEASITAPSSRRASSVLSSDSSSSASSASSHYSSSRRSCSDDAPRHLHTREQTGSQMDENCAVSAGASVSAAAGPSGRPQNHLGSRGTMASTCSSSGQSYSHSSIASTASTIDTSTPPSTVSSSTSLAPSVQEHDENKAPRSSSCIACGRTISSSFAAAAAQTQTAQRCAYGPEPHSALLCNTQPADQFLTEGEDASFRMLAIPNDAVSFRHFRLQAYKYATISDVVIYHRRGALQVESLELARRVRRAMDKMRAARLARGEVHALEYNVFVVIEPFSVFEQNHPHLVAVDALAWPRSPKHDFAQLEEKELKAFTELSPIGENVYLGNSYEVPLPNPEDVQEHEDIAARSEASSALLPSFPGSGSRRCSSPLGYAGAAEHHQAQARAQEQEGKPDTSANPYNIAICIEGRDMANMCSTPQLKDRERFFDCIQHELVVERALAAARARTHAANGYSVQTSPAALASLQKQHANGHFVGSTGRVGRSRAKKHSSPSKRGHSSKRNSSFWFSSSSSSSSCDSDFSGDESSEDGEMQQEALAERSLSFQQDYTAEMAVDSLQLSSGRASPVSPDMQCYEADDTLSAAHLTKSLASASQSRCSSPPPAAPARASSTPIKLQYKKQSKSMRLAREEGEARRAARSELQQESARECNNISAEVLPVAVDEIVHLECIATSQNIQNHNVLDALVTTVIEHVVWLRTQARPHLRTSKDLQAAYSSQRGSSQHLPKSQASQTLALTASAEPMARRVLIHCVDGYTDSSLLALAYVMYDQALSLPEAYLYLQNDCNRSFFVYPADMTFLSVLEKRIALLVKTQGRDRFNDDIPLEQQRAILEAEEREEAARAAAHAALSPAMAGALSAQPTLSAVASGIGRGVGAATREMAKSLLPRPSLFSRSSSKDSTTSTSTMRGPAAPSHSGHIAPQDKAERLAAEHAWFYDQRFDGHFPSRILPYLYLGNVGHASNALMLKALGITHVLSIGESALIPPSKQTAPDSRSAATRARTPTNSLWLEQSLGNITVMDVQDINDDGVDSILPHLLAGMEFIEQARRSGGKCLVHCRVGVSRSATIVIGKVMQDLDLSLAEAYMLVRARRLNILIQPTILFMHTLWSWEEYIRNPESVNERGDAPIHRSNRICWPVLTQEMANMNAKYLQC